MTSYYSHQASRIKASNISNSSLMTPRGDERENINVLNSSFSSMQSNFSTSQISQISSNLAPEDQLPQGGSGIAREFENTNISVILDDKYSSIQEETNFSVIDGPTNASHSIQPVLTQDRSSQLALECWNLRKTVLELNSTILKLRNEAKTHKNLIKNLQVTNNAISSENTQYMKDIHTLKVKISDCEKKMGELNATISLLNTQLSKQKKQNFHVNEKLKDSEKNSSQKQSVR
jgi:hypothetical protein